MAESFLDSALAGLRRQRAPSTKRLGTSGTAVYSGFVQQTEKDRRLVGRERYIHFSDIMANVSIVAAGARHFLNLVAKPEWKVEPAEDSPAAVELAETVESIMGDMVTPWHRVVRRAALFKFHGFSIQEWTAKQREDGVIGMLDVEARPQITIERWDCDESGTLQGVVQRGAQRSNEIYLPRGKIVYAVDDALNDSPEGLGLLRQVVEPVERLSRLLQLEVFGYETDLRGVPLGRAPIMELMQAVNAGNISQQQMDSMLQPLRDFIENHIKNPQLGMLLDSQPYKGLGEEGTPSSSLQWGMELLTGNSSGAQGEVHRAIERLNREIARILGVEHLLLGGDGKGSQALSKDKTAQFALVVDSALKELTEVYQADFLAPLWTLNGWDMDLMPSFKPAQIQFRDIEQLTSALVDLATAGGPLMPDDEAINEVRDLLGLSRLDFEKLRAEEAIRLRTAPEPTPREDETPDPEDNREDEE